MANDVVLFGPTGAPLIERHDNAFTDWVAARLADNSAYRAQRAQYVSSYSYPFLEGRPEPEKALILVGDDTVTFTLHAFIAEQQSLLNQLQAHTDRTLTIKHVLSKREIHEEQDILLRQIDAGSESLAQGMKFYRSSLMLLRDVNPSNVWSLRELQLPKATATARWVKAEPVEMDAVGESDTGGSELLTVARQSLREWFGLNSWGELAELLGMVRQTLHAVADPVRQASGATVAKILDAYVLLRAFLRSDRDERQYWLRHEGLALMRDGGYGALAAAIDERLMEGIRPYRPGLAPFDAELPSLPALPDAPSIAHDVRGF